MIFPWLICSADLRLLRSFALFCCADLRDMTVLLRWFANEFFVVLIFAVTVLLRWFVFVALICVCCSDLRCFVALIYVMWLIKTCNMTRSWQTHLSVTWLILTCDMTRSWFTHSCEHDSFQCVTWMMHHMLMHVWHESFRRVTSVMHTWHDAFARMAWLVRNTPIVDAQSFEFFRI